MTGSQPPSPASLTKGWPPSEVVKRCTTLTTVSGRTASPCTIHASCIAGRENSVTGEGGRHPGQDRAGESCKAGCYPCGRKEPLGNDSMRGDWSHGLYREGRAGTHARSCPVIIHERPALARAGPQGAASSSANYGGPSPSPETPCRGQRAPKWAPVCCGARCTRACIQEQRAEQDNTRTRQQALRSSISQRVRHRHDTTRHGIAQHVRRIRGLGSSRP